jgi:hypothetical protein
LSACQSPRPIEVGSNQTGAALIATPSTYGATTVTVSGGEQRACTEPRPNASLASALSANANLEAKEVQAAIEGAAKAGAAVGASYEFESVEFLAHGLFGVCQLLASGAITPSEAKQLADKVIDKASTKTQTTGAPANAPAQ